MSASRTHTHCCCFIKCKLSCLRARLFAAKPPAPAPPQPQPQPLDGTASNERPRLAFECSIWRESDSHKADGPLVARSPLFLSLSHRCCQFDFVSESDTAASAACWLTVTNKLISAWRDTWRRRESCARRVSFGSLKCDCGQLTTDALSAAGGSLR